SWTPLFEHQPAWNLAAAVLLGSILTGALLILLRHIVGLPRGPERSAYRLLMAGGVLAVAGGLTDFLPRSGSAVPKVGPATLLVLLLILSAIVTRRRFLDVDLFLARAVMLLTGAAAATLVLLGAGRLTGYGALPMFVATLAILAVAGPAGRVLMSGARSLLRPEDPLLRAMLDLGRILPAAQERSEVWEAIDRTTRSLSDGRRLAIYLPGRMEREYHPVYRTTDVYPTLPVSCALTRRIEREGAPLTRLALVAESREGPAEDRAAALEALRQFEAMGGEMLAPFLAEGRLAGWIVVGGSRPTGYLTPEVAAALVAVVNQTMASLERIDAQESARRKHALAAVGEMAAGLAHELRNPLGAIHGAAQVLSGDTDPDRAREMLDVIQEESGRLGRVVGEFLDYARPDSPRRESVDLADAARRALRAATAAGLGLAAEVTGDGAAPRVSADPDQIQRAFLNLIRNAREAAGAEGRLRIDVGRDDGGRATVRFRDDGPGIPEEQIAGLFRPFHTTRAGGTGLGLALVHRVVEDHGGEIRVECGPGEGAAFTIVLPALEEVT
ncbi:MAG TPA: ATP-binding protein, partial [Candidatus Polarisedimenticolia bacterium]|nr:ATP-binding protein [Candidatus Polarisedimenticolia bacterium]